MAQNFHDYYPIHKLKFKKMKKVIFILFLAMLGINKLSAQTKMVVSDKKGWHKIGETTVDFTKERDEITVIGADRFAALIFRVEDAPINIMDIEIFYESGDNQKVSVNFPVKAPGQTKEIDIKGGERAIKKIVFVYKTISNKKDEKAHVEIYGLKTNVDKK
ncbi:hypothetical protein CNR22_14325 [Sphingobacteriaceae bacterium]|nr:hypothetical protein CNR22_14325 [Sphingobacteriaceae bacterium]